MSKKKQSLTVVFRIIERARGFVQRRARLLSKVFFAASFILLLLVLLTVASMILSIQSPLPIDLDKLVLLGIHVYVFFSIGRKLRRKSVVWESAMGRESLP